MSNPHSWSVVSTLTLSTTSIPWPAAAAASLGLALFLSALLLAVWPPRSR